jgi:hypothetical protein
MDWTGHNGSVQETSQSKWVARSTLWKRDGFYVDLAANHPEDLSNTVWLERKLSWRGICIEPVPQYAALLRARRLCTVVQATIDAVVQEVAFDVGQDSGSGIVGTYDFGNARGQKRGGRHARLYEQPLQEPNVTRVWTRTLGEVLASQGAPAYIDYMSLDVEGAEERALSCGGSSSFPWARYTFGLLGVERPSPRLNACLFSHGYLFVKNHDVQDSLYVHRSHPRASQLASNRSFTQIPSKCIDGRRRITRMSRKIASSSGSYGCHPYAWYGCCEWPGFPDAVGGVRYGPNGTWATKAPGYQPGVCPGSVGC